MTPLEWLERSGAQGDVVTGLRAIAGDWGSLYRECPRGDWLLGIAVRLRVPHASLVRAAVGCARVAVDLAEGTTAQAVLDLAERWADAGDADRHALEAELARATSVLDASLAAATSPASHAASSAALAVGLGVHEPEMLVAAASGAAEAIMVSSMDCGLAYAMRWAHAKGAEAVRAAVPWDTFASQLP